MGADASLVYEHNPRPIGGPVRFALTGSVLKIDSGRKVEEVALGRVVEFRLSYEPSRFGYSAFRTRMVLAGGKTVAFSSLTWKTPLVARQQASEYSAFVRALVTRIRKDSPGAQFVAGKPGPLWLLSAAVGFGSLVIFALIAWHAFRSDMTGLAIAGLAVIALGLWQIEPLVRLNRPRAFLAEDPPRELLP